MLHFSAVTTGAKSILPESVSDLKIEQYLDDFAERTCFVDEAESEVDTADSRKCRRIS